MDAEVEEVVFFDEEFVNSNSLRETIVEFLHNAFADEEAWVPILLDHFQNKSWIDIKTPIFKLKRNAKLFIYYLFIVIIISNLLLFYNLLLFIYYNRIKIYSNLLIFSISFLFNYYNNRKFIY